MSECDKLPCQSSIFAPEHEDALRGRSIQCQNMKSSALRQSSICQDAPTRAQQITVIIGIEMRMHNTVVIIKVKHSRSDKMRSHINGSKNDDSKPQTKNTGIESHNPHNPPIPSLTANMAMTCKGVGPGRSSPHVQTK